MTVTVIVGSTVPRLAINSILTTELFHLPAPTVVTYIINKRNNVKLLSILSNIKANGKKRATHAIKIITSKIYLPHQTSSLAHSP